ncbi:tryptophan 7-halogenase (plasmid) [Haladaptatus sp. SPP-AMP-3]|uniref:NAD(P)/FAD-dependent oxidoreductase n=1 Tax=Haladaptatus sp. SPP-AMP-3 TaxID=3121295 RepID=UPI003C2FDDD7
MQRGTMTTDYDVIVGGSGIAGSTTATILADAGLDVLLVEAGAHPRFVIGEGLLPQSSMWMWIVGEYFDIPEIRYLSDANEVVNNITSSCGIKHSIAFSYHREGESFDGDDAHQLIPPQLPFYSESHFLRADIDHYLVETAEAYGVEYVEETPIVDVDIDSDEITVTTDDGTTTAAFYVDATGGNSVLAEERGYREDAPAFATDSRAIFAHVEGLEPFDDVIAEADRPGQSNRLHDGTLHHVFDGGWMWVIPFDNFERSDATKASVGLVLDRDTYPVDESVTPEREFFGIVEQFPGIARHLEGVEPTMPWIRTGRLQRSATRSSGHRHFLTGSTYGFVDPLYSLGLVHTFESVFVSTNLLLDAFEAEDFSAERFERLDELHREQTETVDATVSNAYKALGDFAVWNAWAQFALAQMLFEDLYIQRHCFDYLESGERAVFDSLLTERRPGVEAPFAPDASAIFETTSVALDDYATGEVSAEAAAEVILGELRDAEWLPNHVYDWGSEDARHVDFSDPELVEAFITWGKTESPDHLREHLFDFQLTEME